MTFMARLYPIHEQTIPLCDLIGVISLDGFFSPTQ